MSNIYNLHYFEVQVSCFRPDIRAYGPWRCLKSNIITMRAADQLAKRVYDAGAKSAPDERDRVRVVRIESTCTVLHEIK